MKIHLKILCSSCCCGRVMNALFVWVVARRAKSGEAAGAQNTESGEHPIITKVAGKLSHNKLIIGHGAISKNIRKGKSSRYADGRGVLVHLHILRASVYVC